jgi:hypothetical protein
MLLAKDWKEKLVRFTVEKLSKMIWLARLNVIKLFEPVNYDYA